MSKLHSIVASLLVLMVVGCGSLDQGRLVGPTDKGPVDNQPPVAMTPRERIEAVKARSRMANASLQEEGAARETMIRKYNPDGTVQYEMVRRDGQWVERASTIPARLMEMPLAAFLDGRNMAASCQGSSCAPISWLDTGVIYDSASSQYSSADLYSVLDSVNYSAGLDVTSANVNLESSSVMSGGTDVLSMTSADVYFIAPGTADEVMEVTFTGSDLLSVKNQFISDTTGLGAGSAMIKPVSSFAPPMGGVCDPVFMYASSAAFAKQCTNWAIGMAAGFLAAGTFAITGAFVAAASGGTATPLALGLFAMARGSVQAATISTFGYLICRAMYPNGAMVPLEASSRAITSTRSFKLISFDRARYTLPQYNI